MTTLTVLPILCHFVFFFNDTATTEIYTLSLHDALPILAFEKLELVDEALHAAVAPLLRESRPHRGEVFPQAGGETAHRGGTGDRKSTRLNSSHANISYAVFCLKKKKKTISSQSKKSINI